MLADLPEALHLVVISFCDMVTLLQLEAVSSISLSYSRDVGSGVWEPRLCVQATAMRSLGFDSRQLCISFARAKQCSTTVDYPYSDFLQEHEEGSSAAVMARWYDDVVEAKPPVVVITVGGHATVARWGE